MSDSQWELLKSKYPRLYKELKETSYDDEYRLDFTEAKNGCKTLQIEYKGKKVFMHSSYDPIREAKIWAESIDIKPDSIIVVFGIGCGYHITALSKRLDESNRILAIEPLKNVFTGALEANLLEPILNNDKVFVYAGDDDKEIAFFLSRYIPYDKMEHCIFADFGQYRYVFARQYKAFTDATKDVINSKVINRNTLLHFAVQWQDNLFDNLPYALQSVPINRILDKFEGKPVVIVSAGPSLDKNMHLLKEIKNKALIICVGTALKALLKEDITPDMVISVDGGYPNYVHFKDLPCTVPLVYGFTIYPAIVSNWKGPKFLMGLYDIMSLWLQQKLGEPIGMIMPGPSVANVAFSMALSMKANPIILIGQDLAYAPDGRTHAEGTTYENSRVQINGGPYKYVEGIDGKLVPTSPSFLSFMSCFENTIQATDSNAIFIDATEGGAKIHGTQVMTFKDAIDRYCVDDIRTSHILDDVICDYQFPQKDKIESIIEELEQGKDALKEIKHWSRNGIRLSEKLFDIYKYGKAYDVNRIIKHLDDIDMHIKEQNKHFPLIASISELITFKVMNGFEAAEHESEMDMGIRIASRSKALYEGFFVAISHILPHIDNCIEKMKLDYESDDESYAADL